MKFARAGLTLQEIPQEFRPATSLPGGVTAEGILFTVAGDIDNDLYSLCPQNLTPSIYLS